MTAWEAEIDALKQKLFGTFYFYVRSCYLILIFLSICSVLSTFLFVFTEIYSLIGLLLIDIN